MKLLSILIIAVGLISAESSKGYQIFKDKLNWHAAFLKCLTINMELATIHTHEEDLEMINLIKNEKDLDTSKEFLWTSGYDVGENGKWFWMSSGPAVTYSQPDTANKNCLYIWNNTGEPSFGAGNCADQMYYVCEKLPKGCNLPGFSD